MFLQLCPVVPVGAGVPAVIGLDQVQVSARAVLEETKQLLCHLRACCAPGWRGGRCDARFSASCSPVFITSVRLCVPWPSANCGSRGQPWDTAPCCAALCPGSASLPCCRRGAVPASPSFPLSCRLGGPVCRVLFLLLWKPTSAPHCRGLRATAHSVTEVSSFTVKTGQCL